MKHPTIRVGCGRLALSVVLLCLGCPRAEAHLVTTGFGPVYDGVAHLALSPADLALLAGLVFLVAMRGARHGRWLLVVLPAAWLAGGVVGLTIPVNASLVPPSLLSMEITVGYYKRRPSSPYQRLDCHSPSRNPGLSRYHWS